MVFFLCQASAIKGPASVVFHRIHHHLFILGLFFSLFYSRFTNTICRISVVFRVRSAKAVKITDATLLKRLGIICFCVGIGLLVRTIVAPPVVIVGRTADDLKAFLCKSDWWDHTFTSSKYSPSSSSFRPLFAHFHDIHCAQHLV